MTLELVETSLRAGQQALLVSRLRQRHAVPVIELLDSCGFAALDVFGGATFEASLRFLAENPFERLRALRRAAPDSQLMASLGGQSLVGHRHVADDVVDTFVAVAANAGIDIFRVHDPLNDVRNLERVIAAVVAAGRSAEGAIIYSDGPGGALEVVIEVGRALADRGCQSLCLHDPLGVLSVALARQLVSELRSATGLPIGVCFTAQTGQADFAYLAAAEAGASRADVALSPLAGGASVPAAEAVISALRGTDMDPGLDLERVASAALALESCLLNYADVADVMAMRLDTAALRGLLPPSAMGHALAELRDRDALDRIMEVEQEVSRVRRELGSPALITPVTEIVATQAVYNVCDGDRYATISQEVKDYCLGLYGSPPSAIDADVRRIVNGREHPITLRPADLLEPQLASSRRELEREGLVISDEAVVGHALFAEEWLSLLRGELVAELLGDEPHVAEPEVTSVAVEPAEVVAEEAPQDVRDLTVEVDGQSYTVRVTGSAGSFGGNGSAQLPSAMAHATGATVLREGTVTAPMQGMILKVAVAKGDRVELGQVVAVLEAMKMQNDITAPRAGTVSQVFVAEGVVVSPRDPIVHIE